MLRVMLPDAGAVTAVAVLLVERSELAAVASIPAATISTCVPPLRADSRPLNVADVDVRARPISLAVVALSGTVMADRVRLNDLAVVPA